MLGTLLVGARLLGALRGLTVRLWSSNGWVVRQGTSATMVLWAVSLAAHFFIDSGGGHAGVSGLAQASFLLYVALTLAAQNYVVYRRAVPLWHELGPEAGRPFQFIFGSIPGGAGSFFTNFGNAAGPGRRAGPDPALRRIRHHRRRRGGRSRPAGAAPPALSRGRRPGQAAPSLHSAAVQAPRRFSQEHFKGPPGSTEILLVRHGASADHVEGESFELLEGQGDPPLSEMGRRQAELVADRLERGEGRGHLRLHAAPHHRDGGPTGRTARPHAGCRRRSA